ncbi:SGNH/GDSL hydrolase family protein [Pararhizobium haloflavum]|uniref:SGNH/GDSL hydrolase family protein n=1 Tax=Pararhizobium haloflavum TaxID=2037914 RepID=UPI000C190CE7|nr:DUF459 domain-containing protein [Pararhizobium haloflavum]
MQRQLDNNERNEPRHAATLARSVVLIAAALVAFAITPLVLTAEAQQRVERRSIIDMLFGPRQQPNFPPPPQRAQPQRQQAPQSRPRQRSSQQPSRSAPRRQQASTPAAPPAVEKSEDASTILVVGDFMASGLAEGLEATFAENPDIVVERDTNGSSGLVRDDFYDWHAALPGLIDESEPEIVVVMLGSNDRQQMRVDGQTADVRSEAWSGEYARRVEELAKIVTDREIGLVWVGAPAFQSPRMSADILAFNDIYRERIDAASGSFVDIWDGFVDESGAFIFTGSDVQGQQVRLRGSDGINMTAAGKQKLAFYAEKPIRRILDERNGDGQDTLAALPRGSETAPPQAVVPQLVTRTPPMRITDPAFDGGEQLLGGDREPYDPALKSPRDELVETGTVAPAPVGRADNFRWPPKQSETGDADVTGAPSPAGQNVGDTAPSGERAAAPTTAPPDQSL